MLVTPAISVHDLLEAAAALGLTNDDVAAHLGVEPAVFNRAAEDARNGKNPTVSRKSAKIYAAAAALIEEAGEIRETRKKGRGRQSASAGPDEPVSGDAGDLGVDAAGHQGADRVDQPEDRSRAKASENGSADKHHADRHANDASHADDAGQADDRTDDADDYADGHAGDRADYAKDRSNGHADTDNDPGDLYHDLDAAGLIAAAAALAGRPDLETHARAIIRAAASADMDAADDDQLVAALASVWKGVGRPAIKKLLRTERDAYLADQGVAGGKQLTAADLLFELVEKAGWKTWKDRRTDEAVVTVAHGQHLPARSRLMRQALIRLWKNQRPDGRRVCPTEAVDFVIATLAAEAAALKPVMTTVVRYAAAGDNRMAPDGVVVDFGDDTFEALFITPTGMTVIGPETIDAMGIRFVRPMLMSELPRPKSDATPQEAIDSLSQLISLDQATDAKLVFGVLVASLLPLPAVLPVIVLAAPQGSGKTAVANGLKSVLDPAAVGASAMPKTRDDLVVRLSKARCVALDNVSSLNDDTSDLLCIASTGGSSTRRTLYTDDDEIALRLHATSILTAIDELIFGRSDLLSRAVILGLMKPPGGQQSERQTEAFWTAALPVILGGLYAALSRVLDKINWSGKSAHGRLAASVQVLDALDAAGVCCGGFVSVYAASRQAAAGDFVLRDEMLRDIIRTVLGQPMSPIDGSYSWAGSGSALYAALGGNRHNAGKDWPRSDAALTRRLKELAPVLDQVGVVVQFRRTKKARSTEIIIDEMTADALRAAASRAGSPFPEDLDEAET